MAKLSLMAVQVGVATIWREVGLEAAAPAFFDSPPAGTVPPFTKLELVRRSREPHGLGEIWIVDVRALVRVSAGDPRRKEIETKLHAFQIAASARMMVAGERVIYCRELDDLGVGVDDTSYQGKPVDKLAAGWTVAAEERSNER